MRRHPFQKNVYIDPELRDHIPEQTFNDLFRRLKESSSRLSSGRGTPVSDFTFIISDKPKFVARFTGRSNPPFPLFILTPRGLENLDRLPAECLVFHTLAAAADWIVAHPDGTVYLDRAIAEGATALQQGELTAFPTETVYGLGANALNENAVRKIFSAKRRPLFDPLIVHIGDYDQLPPLVREIPDGAGLLAEAFWPGPLTMVLPKSSLVSDLVTSSHPTVALRMPSHPWARKLLRLARLPVAAPSANLFGRTSPTTATHVADQLAGSYAVLIDAGACRVGVESTVLSFAPLAAGKAPQLLRSGGVSREEIEAVIGPVGLPAGTEKPGSESPGMLPSHYSPLTPLEIVDDVRKYAASPDVGAVLYRDYVELFSGPTVQVSRERRTAEIAINIYAALRRLDEENLRMIVVELSPEDGVGTAVNDRLRKAAAPRG